MKTCDDYSTCRSNSRSRNPLFYLVLLVVLLLGVVVPGFYAMVRSVAMGPGSKSAEPEVTGLTGAASIPADSPSDSAAVDMLGSGPGVVSVVSEPAPPHERVRRLENLLAGSTGPNQATAEALIRFAADRKLSTLDKIDRDDMKALVRQLAEHLPPEEVAGLLEDGFRIPRQFTLAREDKATAVMEVFDAVRGDTAAAPLQSGLILTDACASDGRVTGSTHVIPAGAQQVYAVFENARGLENLSHVFAVWRNPKDDRMVFAELEKVRPGTSYNYVWLRVNDGWPAGTYQVDLYHPERQSVRLASETFNVR